MDEPIRPEGPNQMSFVDISVNPNIRAEFAVACKMGETVNKLQEYDCLQKQIEDGQYDGDGPADVADPKEA